MNYLEIYHNLMNSRKLLGRKKGAGEYFESHHVVPRWLGGSDGVANRVLLTAREHMVAHKLLWKYYRNRQSALALHRMTKSGGLKMQRCFNSRDFEIARTAFAESQTGSRNHMFGKEHPNKGGTHPSRGAKLGPREWMRGDKNPSKRKEVRQKISDSTKGKKKSPDHVAKVVATCAQKPKIICEHCGKHFDFRNFARWHGDRCKKK